MDTTHLPSDDRIEGSLAGDVADDDGSLRPPEVSPRELREPVLPGDIPKLQPHLDFHRIASHRKFTKIRKKDTRAHARRETGDHWQGFEAGDHKKNLKSPTATAAAHASTRCTAGCNPRSLAAHGKLQRSPLPPSGNYGQVQRGRARLIIARFSVGPADTAACCCIVGKQTHVVQLTNAAHTPGARSAGQRLSWRSRPPRWTCSPS